MSDIDFRHHTSEHIEHTQQRWLLQRWHVTKWFLDVDLFRPTFFFPDGYQTPYWARAVPHCPLPRGPTLAWLLENWRCTKYHMDHPPFRRLFFPAGERPTGPTPVDQLIRPRVLRLPPRPALDGPWPAVCAPPPCPASVGTRCMLP